MPENSNLSGVCKRYFVNDVVVKHKLKFKRIGRILSAGCELSVVDLSAGFSFYETMQKNSLKYQGKASTNRTNTT